MAYWYIKGVDKSKTGSLDTAFNETYLASGEDGAWFLGCDIPSGTVPEGWFYNSGSEGNGTAATGSMFTPFPNNNDTRGKLYFLSASLHDNFTSTTGLEKSGWNPVEPPEDGEYLIVTPTLANSDFNTTDHIAIYHFGSLTDLWTNGYRAIKGVEDSSDPLATKSNWDTLKTDSSWASSGLDYDSGDSTTARRSKEQIIACILAYTKGSKGIQDNLSLTGGNAIRGAVLMADVNSEWTNSTWKGIVPFVDSLVEP